MFINIFIVILGVANGVAKLYHLSHLRERREESLRRESGVRLKPPSADSVSESTITFGGERLLANRQMRIEAHSKMLQLKEFRRFRAFQMRKQADFLSHGGTDTQFYEPRSMARLYDRLAFSAYVLDLLDSMVQKADSSNNPLAYPKLINACNGALTLFRNFFCKPDPALDSDYGAMESALTEAADSLGLSDRLMSPAAAAKEYMKNVDRELDSINGLQQDGDDIA